MSRTKQQMAERIRVLEATLRWVGSVYLMDDHEHTIEDRAKVEAVLGEPPLTDYLQTGGPSVPLTEVKENWPTDDDPGRTDAE